MAARVENVPGISILVDDLIAVRNQLGNLARSRRRRRIGSHTGAREIQLRGRGMEYEESRAYVYGDDVRTMDWRVMARTDICRGKGTLLPDSRRPLGFDVFRHAFRV